MTKRLMQLLRDNVAAERKPLPLNVARSEAGATVATLYLYDTIDPWWGANATDLAKALAGLTADTTLHLRINSPGGDVFEGRAMATALKAFQGKTIAFIDALAASAATTVALACQEVEIADGAFFMIHNAWTYAYGNKADLTATVDLLAKIDQAIAADYAKRTGKSTDEIAALMDAETWFTAQETVDIGFADRLTPADADDKAAAKNRGDRKAWNLAAFERAPKALTEPTKPSTTVDQDMAAAYAHTQRRLQLLQIA